LSTARVRRFVDRGADELRLASTLEVQALLAEGATGLHLSGRAFSCDRTEKICARDLGRADRC
jgi:hypothetical protein